MPLELIASGPRTPELRAYDELPLCTGEIRIRSTFASPKHGTELVAYRDAPAAHRVYDVELGAMRPRIAREASDAFPRPLGNMAVGTVSDIGAGVTRFRGGETVFGHLPIRETHTVAERMVDPLPPGLSPEAAVCLDPAVMALAIRDARIGLGDRVALFGLGAIGLFAVQLARLAGASHITVVDPIAPRRALALGFGADVVLDPSELDGDIGRAIRELTDSRETPQPDGGRIAGGYVEAPTQSGQRGVDVAVESTGVTSALHQAIRATRFGGTVCVLSFYGNEATGLHLGEEFHINQIELRSARSQSLPLRDAPGWSLSRLTELALDWLISGKLSAKGIVDPIVPFAECVAAYRAIDEHPERAIKLGIRFG